MGVCLEPRGLIASRDGLGWNGAAVSQRGEAYSPFLDGQCHLLLPSLCSSGRSKPPCLSQSWVKSLRSAHSNLTLALPTNPSLPFNHPLLILHCALTLCPPPSSINCHTTHGLLPAHSNTNIVIVQRSLASINNPTSKLHTTSQQSSLFSFSQPVRPVGFLPR